MVDYTLDKVLSKVKRIVTGKLDDTKILIDADNNLPDDIFLCVYVFLSAMI